MFDLRDFDETLLGPFEWDVKRLAASLVDVPQFRDMKIIPTTEMIAPVLVEFATACCEALRRGPCPHGRPGGHQQLHRQGPQLRRGYRPVRTPLRRSERAGPRPTGRRHRRRRGPQSPGLTAVVVTTTGGTTVTRRRLTLLAMCISQGMILLDITIVNVALPSIQRELSMSPGRLEWVVSAYALSLAALIPFAGTLGDHYGRRHLFLIGMVVFTVGSIRSRSPPPIPR